MKEKQFDVIVIGSGPGGEGASMKAAKCGKKVAVIEKNDLIGGNCTHTATIPSKVLRYSVQELGKLRFNPLFQKEFNQLKISYPDLLKSAESVIKKQVEMRQTFYKRNNIEVIHGTASFTDSNTVEVMVNQHAKGKYSAKAFIIASGSIPYHPPNVDFTHSRILDSDTVLTLRETPSLLLYMVPEL